MRRSCCLTRTDTGCRPIGGNREQQGNSPFALQVGAEVFRTLATKYPAVFESFLTEDRAILLVTEVHRPRGVLSDVRMHAYLILSVHHGQDARLSHHLALLRDCLQVATGTNWVGGGLLLQQCWDVVFGEQKLIGAKCVGVCFWRAIDGGADVANRIGERTWPRIQQLAEHDTLSPSVIAPLAALLRDFPHLWQGEPSILVHVRAPSCCCLVLVASG